MKMNQVADPYSLSFLVTGWQWGPFPLLVFLFSISAIYLYLKGYKIQRAKNHRWPFGRVVSFIAGILSLDIALQSSIAYLVNVSFVAHIIQHLLLMIAAPALLALSNPSTMILQTAPKNYRQLWSKVLHSPIFVAFTNPITTWFTYYGLMWGFYNSSLIKTAMDQMFIMDIFNVAFFFASTCFWWPLISKDPITHFKMNYGFKLLTLAIGVPFESFLGVAIMSRKTTLAPMYSLSQIHAGGELLWIISEVVIFVGIVPIFIEWIRAEERKARRIDRELYGSSVVADDSISG